MVIIEVQCIHDVPDPDAIGAGRAQNFKAAAGYKFIETAHGVIITKRRSVFVPWASVRGCPVEMGEEVKKTGGRAGVKASADVPA